MCKAATFCLGTRLFLSLVCVVLSGSLTPSNADELTVLGRARVVDGDTIEVQGTKVRLFGIDAPEGAQDCIDALGKNYRCGDVATVRLRELVRGRDVLCKGNEHDRYGRLLAVCSAGSVELNETLVREGLAWAFVRYSSVYSAIENEARSARRGIFAGENTPPWDFRAKRWEAPEQQTLPNCPIKGNVNRSGERIYHMPWQADYAKVKMDEKRGKRWFCDEGEAERAGWRRAAR